MGIFNKVSLPEPSTTNKLPRVLVVDLSIRYGGASTRAIAIAQHFSPWGGMIAGIENSPVINIARQMGIPVRVVGKRRLDPFIPFRLAKIIRADGIQVVDTQNIQSKFWVSLAVWLVNVVFVSTLNSFYRLEFGRSWKSYVYHLMDLITNWKTDKFVAVSETIQDGLIADGIPPTKISLIKNAVVVPEESKDFAAGLVREEFGIPKDAMLCVLVGRLVWAKGIDDFINAFFSVTGQIENAAAVIVGEGELRELIEKQVIHLGLEKQVFLAGYQSHEKVLQLLKTADIFVMSSRSEGIPFALLEAAALGMPIVSTTCGGIPEVVTDGVSALLVDIGDMDALANSIILLCKDKHLARRLGENARKKIEEDYSMKVQMEFTEKTYISALESK